MGLGESIRYLADRCNYASTQDGVGFAKFDTARGHMFASLPEEEWTPKQRYSAWQMLRKYKKQLAGGGIDYDKIPVPPVPDSERRITGGETAFKILFPYDQDLVLAVKKLPHAQFAKNGSTYWVVSASKDALLCVSSFADEHGFFFDESAYTIMEKLEREDVKPPNFLKITKGTAGNFIVNFPYDQNLVDGVKAIAGSRYQPNGKNWTVPADKAKQLFEYGLKNGFDLGPLATFDDDLKKQREEEEARKKLLLANLDLDVICDGKLLYEHQKVAAKRMVEDGRMILADQMGLGKTRSALVAAKAYHAALQIPILVIAPVSLRENWLREAAMVGVPIEMFSWAKVPKPLEASQYVFIADESHYAQAGGRTQRGKAFLELALHKNCIACFPLTGTPIKNGKNVNLFPLLQAVKSKLADNKREYEKYFCGAHATRFSKWDVSGSAHSKELHEQSKDVMLRRTKDQCLDLPLKTRVLRKAELSTEAQETYNKKLAELRAEYFRRLHSGEILDGGEALVMLNNLRHSGSLAKVETAIELAEEVLDEGGQIVIFTEFLESAKQIHEKLGGELLTGESTNRQAIVDRFQSGQSKVFTGTIKAGGLGITLTAANTVVLVDRAWTPGDCMQAEDRLHRIGQKGNVTAVWLQANGCDAKIDDMLQEKEKNISLVLKGEAESLQFSLHDAARQIIQELFN